MKFRAISTILATVLLILAVTDNNSHLSYIRKLSAGLKELVASENKIKTEAGVILYSNRCG